MSAINMQSAPQTYARLFRPWIFQQQSNAAAALTAQHKQASDKSINKPANVATATASTRHEEPLAIPSKRKRTPPATNNNIKEERWEIEDAESNELIVDIDVDDDDGLHTSRTSECASRGSNSCHSHLSDENIFSSPSSSQHTNRSYPRDYNFYSAQLTLPQPPQQSTQLPKSRPYTREELISYARQMHKFSEHYLPSTTAPTVTTMSAPVSPDLFYTSNAEANALCRTNNIVPSLLLPAPTMPTTNICAPINGMDLYTAAMMDQEFARIMTEEARIKAMNARKQRPKKFKCPHCDVAFSNNGQLKGHIRIHTGERPFKCDFENCGKSFTRNEELTRHKRIHSGVRPFPCQVCGKRFGRRDHLKKHLRTHMPPEQQMGPTILFPMYNYLYGY